MTEGRPVKALLLFTLPLIAGDFFHLFYSMADAFIVGRTLGINALAAVGCTVPLVTFVSGFAIGMTGGFSIVLAQRFGAAAGSGGDTGGKASPDGVRRSFTVSILLCLITGVLLIALLLPLIRPFLRLLNTPAEITDDAVAYMFFIIGGIGFSMLNWMLTAAIRSMGDSRRPLYFMVASSLVNIALDYCFILVFHWGVAGAAAATILAQIVSLLCCSVFIRRRLPQLLPTKTLLRSLPALLRDEAGAHLGLGISMGLQRSIVEVGNILVQGAMNSLGAMSIAAVAAGQRIRQLNMLPLFCMSMAIATFTAQNYGAARIRRIYQGIRHACFISLSFCAVMFFVNFLFGPQLAGLFLKDAPEAVALSSQYLRFIGASLSFLGLMLIFRSALQALGKSISPTICSILETVMSVATAFVFIPAWGFIGVCLANPLSWIASGIPLYIAFALFVRKQRKNFNRAEGD
ncbi:MATE family efflux transporter [Spirochaetia bacterium]|nr:MATE family efflux transporter [Spirochaetia bacterium]